MSIHVEILSEERLQVAVYSGHVSLDDVGQHWQTLAATPSYEPDFDELLIYAYGADLSALAFEFAKTQAQRFLDAHDWAPMRSCLVCPDPIHVQMARLYIAYIRSYEPKFVEFAQFEDVQSAVDWVNAGRACAGRGVKAIDGSAVERALAAFGADGARIARPDLSSAS
jgi:hypothetical protein